MVDSNTGFGGYAQAYLTEVKEEIPKIPILLYSVKGMEVPIDIEDED
jgi:hypothetical protein